MNNLEKNLGKKRDSSMAKDEKTDEHEIKMREARKKTFWSGRHAYPGIIRMKKNICKIESQPNLLD